MDKEKFEAVVGYFEDLNIELPSDVKNAIEDVFRENDSIDGVECYHLEDKEQFEIDLKAENIVILNMDGSHSGSTMDFYTYYGGVEYSLTEKTLLYNNDELIHSISDIEGSERSPMEYPDDYSVILIERKEWDTSKNKDLQSTTTLYIYCPIYGDGLSEEDLKYQGIYNDLKSEEDNG